MPASIFAYLRAHSWRQQLFILALTLASLPFFYLWVELPKRIVDDALGGGPGTRPLLGFELSRLDYLIALCSFFLLLVLVNNGFKYVINVYKGVVGERMLRRLRYELYGRILRFPPGHFRVMSQGQLVQMINAEVEPLGGFIGDAYSLPAYQGGMLLTILVFMFLQNPLLGFAAILFYPLQIWLIPKLQRQVNELGRARVRQVRVIAERIGETAQGVVDVRANAAEPYEKARFAAELGKVFFIRFDIYKKKFLIKFINNFLAQFAPFLFYMVGGYLVLQGELTIGAILAVVAAHEKLAAPWRELLTYYQSMWDASIKYEQVVNQFDPPGLFPEGGAAEEPASLATPRVLEIRSLVVPNDDGDVVLQGASLRLDLPTHAALIGSATGGQDALAQAIAGLRRPTAGTLRLDEADLTQLPLATLTRHVAYVGNPSQVFQGSVRDNLLYGLKRKWPPDDGRPRRERDEALAAGNSPYDAGGDWVDYAALGVAGEAELADRLPEVLAVVRLDAELFALGLRRDVGIAEEALAEGLLRARRLFAERTATDARLQRLVETFDPERYNTNATMAENLLFGTPLDAAFEIDALPRNRRVATVLAELGLDVELRRIGYEMAAALVDLFAELPADHEYYRQFNFVAPEDLQGYRALVGRIGPDDLATIQDPEDRLRLETLPLRLIPSRHRVGLIDEAFQNRIVQARRRLHESLSEAERAKIAFFDPERINAAASVQDNVLFGRVAYGQANAQQVVAAVTDEVVDALELRPSIVGLGLDQPAGIGGIRLSASQRQKVAIARALLRRPAILVLDDALALIDRSEQNEVRARLLAGAAGRTVLWTSGHDDDLGPFDVVVRFEDGTVSAVEAGAGGGRRAAE